MRQKIFGTGRADRNAKARIVAYARAKPATPNACIVQNTDDGVTIKHSDAADVRLMQWLDSADTSPKSRTECTMAPMQSSSCPMA